VTGFVAPGTGEVVWYISTAIDKALFELMLATFAAETGAGKTRRIVLVLDNAGWHAPPDLTVPEGLRLVFLPPSSPELQPAEHLWPLLDEPLVNRNFETLDAILTDRCRTLVGMPDVIRDHARSAGRSADAPASAGGPLAQRRARSRGHGSGGGGLPSTRRRGRCGGPGPA
jgi:transposase